jgi:hypothetical protein
VLGSMGVGSWPIYRHEAALAEVFPRESIVYLSPDAEEVLEVRGFRFMCGMCVM